MENRPARPGPASIDLECVQVDRFLNTLKIDRCTQSVDIRHGRIPVFNQRISTTLDFKFNTVEIPGNCKVISQQLGQLSKVDAGGPPISTKIGTLTVKVEAGLSFERATHKVHLVTREDQIAVAQTGFQLQIIQSFHPICQLIGGDLDIAVELSQSIKQRSQVIHFQVAIFFSHDRPRTE